MRVPSWRAGRGPGAARPRTPVEPTAADRRLLRRATAVVAVQTGVAAAVVVAVIVALVWSVSRAERIEASEGKVERAVAEAAQAGRPLPFAVDALPEGCSEAAVRAATTGLAAGTTRVEACGGPFVVHVGEAGGERAVAARSVAEQEEETTRLARLLLLVGLGGVVAAAGLGWLVARRAVRPLGEALTSQRRFVADASHELRTPLAIVMTRAQLLQRAQRALDPAGAGAAPGAADAPAAPGAAAEVDQLVEDVRALRDVVDDMLLLAEVQHRPQARGPVDLARVAEEVRASFEVRAAERGVDLGVDLALDDGEPSATVLGVRAALRRAVAALVDNALHHVGEGGSVRIRVGARDGRAEVRVTDDGPGLDPDRAAALLRRFERGGPGATGAPATGVAGGDGPGAGGGRRLGLGLALVDEVVAAHGGRLSLEAADGRGASVTLRFPTARYRSSS